MRILFLSLFDEWCLGLRSLSAVLREDGHDVAIAHLRSMSEMHDDAGSGDPDGYHAPPGSVSGRDFAALQGLIRALNPNLVGISLTSNFFGLAETITRRVRQEFTVPVIWGGIDPTANPDLALEVADYICIGEGEGALTELATRLASGGDVSAIQNLAGKRNGQRFQNPVRPLIQDLDHLPFPDFSSNNKYYIHDGQVHPGQLPKQSNLHTAYPILSGRGCPFSCSYCCNSMLRDLYGNAGYVRIRSVERVINEIEQARRRNPKLEIIEFHDDVFGLRMDWLREFAEIYPRRIGLPISCYTHASTCTEERVSLLKKAGLVFTIVGLQSGSQRVLREIYLRKTTRQQLLQTLEWLRAAGISVVLDLIAHNPLETEEDYQETLDLLLEVPHGFVLHEINPLSIYRNYPLAKMVDEAGLLTPLFPGRNVTGAAPSPMHRFWVALLTLTQFQALDREAIRTISRDAYLREHPEALEAVAHALIEQTYVPGSRTPRSTTYGKAISELNALKGSRLVRAALRIREWLAR